VSLFSGRKWWFVGGLFQKEKSFIIKKAAYKSGQNEKCVAMLLSKCLTYGLLFLRLKTQIRSDGCGNPKSTVMSFWFSLTDMNKWQLKNTVRPVLNEKKTEQNREKRETEQLKRSLGPTIDPGSKSPRVGQNWLNLTLNMSFPHVKIGVQIGQILVGWKLHCWRICKSQSHFLSSLNMFFWMDNWKALD